VSEISTPNIKALALILFATRLAKGFPGSVKAAVVQKVSHQCHRLFKSGHGITSQSERLVGVAIGNLQTILEGL